MSLSPQIIKQINREKARAFAVGMAESRRDESVNTVACTVYALVIGTLIGAIGMYAWMLESV